MCTGYHAAVSDGVKPGDSVAVMGDGAVGLSAVLAAHKLGAARIIALSRNPASQAVAREFGATDIVEDRGDDAIEAVLRLTDGAGGVPLYEKFEYKTLFWKNVGIKGGVTPSRAYIPELLNDVLAGRINPGRVFDFTTDLDHAPRCTPRWTSDGPSSRCSL